MNKTLVVIALILFVPTLSLRADEQPTDVKITPITIKMESVHPRDVLAEFSKQTGVPVQVWPKEFWDQNHGRNGPPTSITVDIENKPFWDAMQEICSQSNLYPQNMGNREGVTLQWRGGASQDLFGKRPTSESENGIVVASSIQRTHTINFDSDNPQVDKRCGVNLEAYIDPRLRMQRYQGLPSIEKAEDDNGNSLIPSDQPSQSMNGVNCSWQINGIFIPLDYDPEKSHKLSDLKGSIHISAAGAVEKLEIDDFDKAQGSEHELAGRKIVIDEIKNGPKSFSMKMTIHREDMTNDEWNMMFQSIVSSLRLEMSDGNSTSLGGGGGGSDKQVTYTMSTNWSDENLKPQKLVWEIPTNFHDVEIPFEFNDLTLP
jgi:hypothetical protein